MDNYQYERELYQKGINYIGGIDEVGRGPLIGPVVAACVVLPKDLYIEGLTDSKRLSEKKRNYYYEVICEKAIAIGIGVVDEKRIDEINIYEATKEAMLLAIKNTNIKMEHILIDAMTLDIDVSDEEMAARRAKWQPREPKVTTGYLKRYASLVTSGNRGAILALPGEQ